MFCNPKNLEYAILWLLDAHVFLGFRVVLTTSNEWGAVVTKLTVPADWKGSLSLFSSSFVVIYFLGCGLTVLFTLVPNMQSGRSIWCF